MRNIWIPSSLLLILVLVCTWQHKGSFGQPQRYVISQKAGRCYLSGALQSQDAVDKLKIAFAAHGVILDTKEAHINALLVPRGSLVLVEKVIPLFVSYCHNAKIVYSQGVLTFSGSVESEVQKRELEGLLRQERIPVKNMIDIVAPPEIHFVITQKRKHYYALEGYFSSPSQQERLQALFEKNRSILQVGSEEMKPQLKDQKRILEKLTAIIPLFISRVHQGILRYQGGVLSIEGKVLHQKEIERAESYLSKLGIEVQNRLTLDMKAIKGRKAKRKAKRLLKALQKQRAKKAAVKKAQQEVSEDIVAMMDAREGKQRVVISDNSKARKNLKMLFEKEVIKFNPAQTTLTPLGLGTVSKIAVILKTYPSVKIEIAGHTDSDGDDAFNMLLSQGRVNNVKRALMREGIAKERIKAVGYGETKPLFPNTTRENKEKNRRVEIIVEGE